ncbi:hypothetical protein JTT01_08000 [Clostridium botulinum]|nr:hypothetical protein [Clostridium botulinum]MCS4467303.1 hypothetical protein [Clostridium botulinum]MCS4516831.1 hypothetical protein [Clostridium botulinum]
MNVELNKEKAKHVFNESIKSKNEKSKQISKENTNIELNEEKRNKLLRKIFN